MSTPCQNSQYMKMIWGEAYKRMRSQWDANKTDDKLRAYLSKNKDAYNEDTKKLFFDNTSFAYNPKKHASRKLQLAV